LIARGLVGPTRATLLAKGFGASPNPPPWRRRFPARAYLPKLDGQEACRFAAIGRGETRQATGSAREDRQSRILPGRKTPRNLTDTKSRTCWAVTRCSGPAWPGGYSRGPGHRTLVPAVKWAALTKPRNSAVFPAIP